MKTKKGKKGEVKNGTVKQMRKTDAHLKRRNRSSRDQKPQQISPSAPDGHADSYEHPDDRLYNGNNGKTRVGKLMSEIDPEPVNWLWKDRVPYGGLTSVDGDPDNGKSTFVLEIAARITKGEPMPCEESRSEPAGGVLLSAEDHLNNTVRPRLDAAGADRKRIVVLPTVRTKRGERLPELPKDVDKVEAAIKQVGAKVVIVDVLMAFLGPKVDAYKDQSIRRALHPLTVMSQELDVAALLIRHFTKFEARNVLHRGSGSVGLGAAMRSGMIVVPDPQDLEKRRIVAWPKKNLAPKRPPALSFSFEDAGNGAARIKWHGKADYTIKQLFDLSGDDEEGSALAMAKEFLQKELEKGPIMVKQILKDASESHISERTLFRAKKALGVIAGKANFIEGWQWTLPEKDPETAEGCQT
jgi:hypothetical protein